MKFLMNSKDEIRMLKAEVKRLKLKMQDEEGRLLLARKKEEKLNSPSFAGSRKNMNEFTGCGMVCKAFRQSLNELTKTHLDAQFTGRLMQLVSKIKKNDLSNEKGVRSFVISSCKPCLPRLVMNKRHLWIMRYGLIGDIRHSESRTEATFMFNGLRYRDLNIPQSATYFRFFNQLSVISDYHFSEALGRYEPSNNLNGLNAISYSPYIPVYGQMPFEISTAFPEGTVIGDDCTVLQFIGFELYIGGDNAQYFIFGTHNTMALIDAF